MSKLLYRITEVQGIHFSELDGSKHLKVSVKCGARVGCNLTEIAQISVCKPVEFVLICTLSFGLHLTECMQIVLSSLVVEIGHVLETLLTINM